MKLQKASVRLTRGATYSGYRSTLYMGLNSGSGPSSPILLESENDLYKYFNTFEKDRSFETASFCLRLGYRVYAKRVNYIIGKSSCRKFIVDNESKYYSPLTEKYEDYDFSFIEPELVREIPGVLNNNLYSAIINFKKPGIPTYDNTLISGKFLIIVPETVYDIATARTTLVYERLIGSDWTDEQLSNYSSSPGQDVKLNDLYYDDFKETVIDFLKNNCALDVTEITDSSIYVQSRSPIQTFQFINCNVVGDETQIIEFVPSDVGYQDNYCRKYDPYKVCTITSKEDSSLDDTEVVITKSLGSYLVDVYKYNSEGVVIYSETFSYGINPENINFISNLSTDSDIVEITIHDESADLSGNYYLKGKEKVETDTMYTDSLEDGSLSELSIDILIDTSNSDRYNYIRALRESSKLSLLFTGYDFVDLDNPDVFIRTCIVCPEVTWRNTGNTLEGFTYLLYLLPSYQAGSDDTVLRRSNLPEGYTDNCIVIEKSDYSIDLMGARVPLVTIDSKFPIKSALSVISVLNYLRHSSFASVREFEETLSRIVSEVNSYLGTRTFVQSEDTKILNHTLSATLNFYVDKQIILSYRVSANLVV